MNTERKYPVVEMFGPTIQGEGGLIGQQTYFIRLGGCDFRCKMCDSMHAVDPQQIHENAKYLTGTELLGRFLDDVYVNNSTQWVTLSGGNPALHEISPLVVHLQTQGFKVHMETQGSVWNDGIEFLDALTVSPKGPGMVEDQESVQKKLYDFLRNFELLPNRSTARNFLKFVVFTPEDLEFASATISQLLATKVIGRNSKRVFPFDNVYLSLGDDLHTGTENDPNILLDNYKSLLKNIQSHPVLSCVKFLPRLHTLLWGNRKGV